MFRKPTYLGNLEAEKNSEFLNEELDFNYINSLFQDSPYKTKMVQDHLIPKKYLNSNRLLDFILEN